MKGILIGASKSKFGKQSQRDNFSWRDEFGIFFDSAERHNSQHNFGTRVCEKVGTAIILHNADRGGDTVVHGDIRGNTLVARRRQRISFAVGRDDFGGVIPAHAGESTFDKATARRGKKLSRGG